MTLPTSFGPATSAIYDALTTTTGRARALAPDRLFLKAASRLPDADAAARAIARKRVLVILRDMTASPGPEMQPGDRLRYSGLCEITREYKSGGELFSDETERARLLALDDVHHMRAALCFPGALETDASGASTGIDGYALTAVGHRSIGPSVVPGAIRWVDIYPITVSLLVS